MNQRAHESSGRSKANEIATVRAGVRHRVGALRRAQASRLGDEERVADVDQVPEVAGQHQTLGGTAEHAERRLELDVVRSRVPCVDRFEEVLMAERPERPLRCSSTKQRGRSHSMIVLVIVHVMPKWRARHVTNSPNPITPAVTPSMARSPECSNDPRWASIDSDRSNAVSGSTGMSAWASKRTTAARTQRSPAPCAESRRAPTPADLVADGQCQLTRTLANICQASGLFAAN